MYLLHNHMHHNIYLNLFHKKTAVESAASSLTV